MFADFIQISVQVCLPVNLSRTCLAALLRRSCRTKYGSWSRGLIHHNRGFQTFEGHEINSGGRCWSVQAAAAESHRMSGLNHRDLFSLRSGGSGSKIKVLVVFSSRLGNDCLLAGPPMAFPLCMNTERM